jgi:hypothetical protein
MAFFVQDQIIPDLNLGAVALTISQADQGAIQLDGVLRLNRELYLSGASLLECLALEDRYYLGTIGAGGAANTYQTELGYAACNFVNPENILFPASP